MTDTTLSASDNALILSFPAKAAPAAPPALKRAPPVIVTPADDEFEEGLYIRVGTTEGIDTGAVRFHRAAGVPQVYTFYRVMGDPVQGYDKMPMVQLGAASRERFLAAQADPAAHPEIDLGGAPNPDELSSMLRGAMDLVEVLQRGSEAAAAHIPPQAVLDKLPVQSLRELFTGMANAVGLSAAGFVACVNGGASHEGFSTELDRLRDEGAKLLTALLADIPAQEG